MIKYSDIKYNIELTDYEIANLREALIYVGTLGGDTGDWYRQVLDKLPNTESTPNHTSHEQRRQLSLQIGWRVLYG